MGVLKFIKDLGKTFMSLPTSTKLKIASGAVFLLGGVAIAAGAAASDVDLLPEGSTNEVLPESENDIIEVEPEIISTEE